MMWVWIIVGALIYLCIGIALSHDVDGDGVIDKVEKVLTVFLWPLPGLLVLWFVFLAANTH